MHFTFLIKSNIRQQPQVSLKTSHNAITDYCEDPNRFETEYSENLTLIISRVPLAEQLAFSSYKIEIDMPFCYLFGGWREFGIRISTRTLSCDFLIFSFRMHSRTTK